MHSHQQDLQRPFAGLPVVSGQSAAWGVKYGVLRVLSVSSLAPSAFLTSAAGTLELQRRLLERSDTTATDPPFDEVMQQWLSMSNAARPTDFRQCAEDQLVVEGEFDILFNRQTEGRSRALLLAAASQYRGSWLHVNVLIQRPAVFVSIKKPFEWPLVCACWLHAV
jgi:hypothetical protein